MNVAKPIVLAEDNPRDAETEGKPGCGLLGSEDAKGKRTGGVAHH